MTHQVSGAQSLELAFGQFKPKPPTQFNGAESQEFSSWLRRFEDMVRMVNPPMPEQLKVNTLVGFLEGEARDLIEELPDGDKNDYNKVVDLLRTHYEGPHFRNLARQQLSDCKQTPNESVREFAERMKKLVKRVTQGQPKTAQNERLLDEFLDRLKPALRFHVKAANPASYDDAIIKAMTYESLLADAVSNLTIFPGMKMETPQVNVASNPQVSYGERWNQPRRRPGRPLPMSFGTRNQIFNRRVYSLPPPNIRPPQQGQASYYQNQRYQQNRPPTQDVRYGRPWNNSQPRAQQFSQRPDRNSNPGQILAMDTFSTHMPETSEVQNYEVMEEKDAQIAALIKRNNELAKLAFATHDQSSSELTEGNQPRARSRSASPPKWAMTCMIRVKYSVNFFGARNQNSVLTEKTVTPEECKQMINHRTCTYGDLVTVGTVMKTQNNVVIDWPSAPFQCCSDYEMVVSNCVTFETTVYAYHGSAQIESPIGSLPGCRYEDGACTMKTGAAVIWKPVAEESCQFIFVATMEGSMADKPLIEVNLPNNNRWKAFLDPITFVITNDAKPIPCSDNILFEFAVNGTVAKYQPLQGIWELLAPTQVTMIENSVEYSAQIGKPALTLFHNLVITNISEFIPEQQLTELWAAIEGNQAVLDNHINPHGQNQEAITIQILGRMPKRIDGNNRRQVQSCAVIGNLEPPLELGNIKQFVSDVEYPRVYTLSGGEGSTTTHIHIKINGVTVSALIDTGSSITLAGKQLCPALGIFRLDAPQTETAIGMAGIHVNLAGSKKVVMEIANVVLQPTLHFTTGKCVPNTHSTYEVIVGNDILALLPKMSIDYQNRVITFGNASVPFGNPRGDESCSTPNEIPVRASKTTRLLANSETFVPCTVEDSEIKKDLVLVSQSTKIFKNDLIVAPAVISTHHPLLLVCNPTNEHKVIFADDPSHVINLDESDINDEQKKRLSELLDTFSDVFSRHQYDIGSCTADLASGYLQLPLDDESSYKCGVITDNKVYQMTHLPFGLKSARYPDYDRPLHIFTDASSVAQAGALMQEDKVVLHCDHKPLSFLLSKSKTHDNLARWMIELQSYNIKIVHIRGTQNSVADALSRAHEGHTHTTENDELEDIVEFPVSFLCAPAETSPSRQNIADCEENNMISFVDEQKKDPLLGLIWELRKNGIIPLSTPEQVKKYIQQVFATPYHSMGNGATERTFGTFQMTLSKFINIKQEDWDLFIPCVAFCYNTSVNEATGETPYFLMFGRDPTFIIDRILQPKQRTEIPSFDEAAEYKAQLVSALHLAWNDAAEHARLYKENMKVQYDKMARPSSIQVGDRVLFRNYTKKALRQHCRAFLKKKKPLSLTEAKR
ncbi:retrotransposon gag protein [Ancylostoma ceylanicum]|uniref:Retrotransposon gag protein n=1 Tax=Ancylostoma ceylanicum TaxID=53326 RepID=A0A0D6LDB5_9BILA|nr:retrotransposon gag protein [Ancylostoma ceylanicum]